MKYPILDGRDLNAIRAQVRALAGSYTPEWRYEHTEDDPGAALAELFCAMFYQTVDRMNALPEKLYTEFLNQIGFQERAPVPARGTMVFTPHDTVDEPVSVPAGTQVFTPDENGENIVYETLRTIQATPALLTDVYFADPGGDRIERLDPERPQAFFTPVEGGAHLQRHCFEIGENNILFLDLPCTVTLQPRQKNRYLEEETCRALASKGLTWYYLHDGTEIPFDLVRVEGDTVVLEKHSSLSLDPDAEGRRRVICRGCPDAALRLEHVSLTSAPLEPCPARGMFAGDVPVFPEDGAYCLGRRPAPYNLFYLRSDTVLSKRGARAELHLDLRFITDAGSTVGPSYDFTQAIIDKQSAVAVRPDDTYISGVVWEYFNGLGWRTLAVSGDRNPFSGKREENLNIVFEIPADLEPTEVNAEEGYYIRVRVTEVENQFSMNQRWIVPFVRGASFQWKYDALTPAKWICAENNGRRTEIEDADRYTALDFDALAPMEPGPPAMYLRFDRSMHAMPLSLHFQIRRRVRLEDQLIWEWWNGSAFEPVRCLDRTENLLHSGDVLLYLPEREEESEQFGVPGYWLRLSRTSRRPGPAPTVASIRTNTVTAVQRLREPEMLFDTDIYEAGKTLQLLASPVLECRVWVDEYGGLSEAEARDLADARPEDVHLEYSDHILTRCWVRWEQIADLALAGPEDRVFVLDPYQGTVSFGDGRQGRVPPAGDHNIRVEYASGGARGNVPAGTVNSPLGGLPRISELTNLTAMSGGTERLSREEIEARGSRRLRTRGRAAGRRDYEDLVAEAFPQVRHVRCFSGRDASGAAAPGHVTVVITGFGDFGEGADALCRDVYDYLRERCSCCLTEEGRLHVCPATVLTVNTLVTVEAEQPELAAETQREIGRRLDELIGGIWKRRPIGGQIRLDEVWRTVRDTPNVRIVRQVLVEGAYDRDGQALLAPLERDADFPYGVVECGTHIVRIQ